MFSELKGQNTAGQATLQLRRKHPARRGCGSLDVREASREKLDRYKPWA